MNKLPAKLFASEIAVLEQLIKSDAPSANKRIKLLETHIEQYSPVQQISFYNVKSEFLLDHGQVADAKSLAESSLEMAKEYNIVNRHVSELTYTLGFAHESLGDLLQAERNYISGIELAQLMANETLKAKGLINLGAIYYLSEKFENSLLALSDALDIANNLKDDELKGLVNSEFGILYGYLGQDDKALEYYQQCHFHFTKMQDHNQALNCLVNIGFNHLNASDYEKAVAVYKQAEKQLKQASSSDLAHSIYLNLSVALLKQENAEPEPAYQYLLIASQYLDDLEHFEAKISFYLTKAYILEELEKFNQAMSALDDAEENMPKNARYKAEYARMTILFLRAKIFASMEKYEKALEMQSLYEIAMYEMDLEEKINNIQEIRLQYESEQADLERKVLIEKQQIDQKTLNEKEREKETQFYTVISISFVTLLFAWWLTRLLASQKKLKFLTNTDALTGAANRHQLAVLGDKAFSRAVTQSDSLSMLMVDVDHFKSINDALGHQMGDKVLKQLVKLFSSMMREHDSFARVGGEEFVCLLNGADKSLAKKIAIRIKDAVADYPWEFETPHPITVSIGVASYNAAVHENINDLFRDADIAMYSAKKAGRDQICD